MVTLVVHVIVLYIICLNEYYFIYLQILNLNEYYLYHVTLKIQFILMVQLQFLFYMAILFMLLYNTIM